MAQLLRALATTESRFDLFHLSKNAPNDARPGRGMTDRRSVPGLLSRKSLSGALLLAAATPALAGNDRPVPVYLICAETALPFCEGLSRSLSIRAAPRPVTLVAETGTAEAETRTIIRFVPGLRSESAVSGRLEWSGPGLAPGAGPNLELSIMDDTLTAEMLSDYAEQLVRMTPLPF